MQGGESIITIGAVALLTFTAININNSFTEDDQFFNQTRFGLEAIALASSIIEEASQLPFDEQSWDSTKIEKIPTDFTIANSLGPDFGETDFATFDDFDDFNGFSSAETTMQNVYNISCNVVYINPAYPDIESINRSFFKKLSVSVSSKVSSDTLSLSYVHGYWYFN